MKKCSRVCIQAGPCDWISRLARGWQVTNGGTRVKHAGELKSYASCCTIRQKSRLARQLVRDLDSRLNQVARPSHQTILFRKN